MTATFDTTTDHDAADAPRALFTRRSIARFVTRVFGAVLVLGGIGIWLEPTPYAGADLVAMKLAVSLVFSLAGFMILQERRTDDTAEVEIDTVRREVRVLTGAGRARKLARRTAIRDLGKAELMGDSLRLTAANGDVLADVSLADTHIRKSLCSALHDAGKL